MKNTICVEENIKLLFTQNDNLNILNPPSEILMVGWVELFMVGSVTNLFAIFSLLLIR